MDRAAVPEASIDEDRHSGLRKDDVSLHRSPGTGARSTQNLSPIGGGLAAAPARAGCPSVVAAAMCRRASPDEGLGVFISRAGR